MLYLIFLVCCAISSIRLGLYISQIFICCCFRFPIVSQAINKRRSINMASVPIEGQLYSRYLAKQKKTQTEEKSGNAVVSTSKLFNRPAKSYLFSTLASPRTTFLHLFNVSSCSSEKMTTDLDFDIKGPR